MTNVEAQKILYQFKNGHILKATTEKAFNMAIKALEKQKEGYWIDEPGKIPKCSVCGSYSDDADRPGGGKACSFCGARMREKP